MYRNESPRFDRPFTIARPNAALDEWCEQGRYYVLQRRGGAMYPWDWELVRWHKPVYTKVIRRGGFGPWNLDNVPILEVYDLWQASETEP